MQKTPENEKALEDVLDAVGDLDIEDAFTMLMGLAASMAANHLDPRDHGKAVKQFEQAIEMSKIDRG